jgi:hypothetical protein
MRWFRIVEWRLKIIEWVTVFDLFESSFRFVRGRQMAQPLRQMAQPLRQMALPLRQMSQGCAQKGGYAAGFRFVRASG